MRYNTEKVNGRQTIRSECVRCDGVYTVFKTSSKDEEYRNEKCLNEDSRLEEESSKEGIDQTKYVCKVAVVLCKCE